MKRWRKPRSWSLGRRHSGNALPKLALGPAVCFTLLTATPSHSGASLAPIRGLTGPPRLLIIAAPQMSWVQFRSAAMPKMYSIVSDTYAFPATPAVALMPVASSSDADPNRIWVTLGAGRAAAGGEIAGLPLPGGGFQIGVGPLGEANERAHTSAVPGLLGSRLREHGITTALIAYQAWERPHVPPTAAVIMDATGHINGGGIYRPAQITPMGKQLDLAQVRSVVTEQLHRHPVVLLDLIGVAPLKHADSAIATATETARREGACVCLLAAFAPAYKQEERRSMGFVVRLVQGERTTATLLTSLSTRWPGVVVPADLAPTILDSYVHPPFELYLPRAVSEFRSSLHRDMTGRPMKAIPTRDAAVQLDRLDRMLTDQFLLEGKAARLYAIYMILLAGATFVIGARRRQCARWLAFPALVGLALPIGLLVCPVAGVGQTRQLAAACAASVAIGLLAFLLGRGTQGPRILLLIGAATIVADPLLGSPLIRFSPLGFGAVTGARFYGIGNEYAGVLGAMAPIYLGLLLGGHPRVGWAAALAGAIVVLVVGAPWGGANWGGCVSVAAGLLAMWVALAPRNRWRRVLVAACGLLVAAALPATLDLLQPEHSRSHIGAAASALIAGQLDATRDTAVRKLEMNWRMAQLASWWWLLAPVGLLGIWELVRRSKERWRQAVAAPIRAGVLGALVMALVALIVNDSGVVMFGMALAVTFAAGVLLMARSEAVTA